MSDDARIELVERVGRTRDRENRLEIVKFVPMQADHFCMTRICRVMIASICSTMSLGFLTLPASATAPSAPSVGISESVGAKPSTLLYVVANGDYLAGIARKLDVTLSALLIVNQFTSASVIHPGMSLVVPEGGTLPANPPTASVPAAAPSAPPYVVVNGDYLAGIARTLGVTLPALLSTNTLTAASVIVPGAKLIVPAGGTLPTAALATPANKSGVQAVPTPAGPVAVTMPSTTTYTILAGDYLVGIAAENGVTLRALLAANNLIVTSAIFPGRQLAVPAATLPIPAAAPTAAGAAQSAQAAQTVSASEAPAAPTNAAPTPYQQSINTLVTFLQAQVGKQYVFNSEGPDTYDCSGLVTAAYRQIGIELPHQSALQSTKGTAVDWSTEAMVPGDLIFQFNSAHPTVISHVGIVIDSSHWIQAGGSTTPVKISPLPNPDKIQAVRRIVQP